MTDMNRCYDIGQRVRSIRISQGLTQAQLAESLDLSINFISEVENGKKGLSQDTICKICDVYDASADYLLLGKKTAYSSKTVIKIAENLSDEDLDTLIEYLTSLKKIRALL